MHYYWTRKVWRANRTIWRFQWLHRTSSGHSAVLTRVRWTRLFVRLTTRCLLQSSLLPSVPARLPASSAKSPIRLPPPHHSRSWVRRSKKRSVSRNNTLDGCVPTPRLRPQRLRTRPTLRFGTLLTRQSARPVTWWLQRRLTPTRFDFRSIVKEQPQIN